MTGAEAEGIAAVLDFWFGPDRGATETAAAQTHLWFGGGADADRHIAERFAPLRTAAIAGELAGWEADARGRLALIVLVDQFSRNIHRGTAQAFAHDALARAWTHAGIARGHDAALPPIQRVFFYLPLEHSESREDQDLSVRLYTRLRDEAAPEDREAFTGFLDYAERHREIVRRFGRFPHRNRILGRASTAEEIEFLKHPGSSF